MSAPNTITIDGVSYVKQEAFVATPTPEPTPEPNDVDCDGRALKVKDYAYVRLSSLSANGINESARHGKVTGMGYGKVQLEFPTVVNGSHFGTFSRTAIRRLAS